MNVQSMPLKYVPYRLEHFWHSFPENVLALSLNTKEFLKNLQKMIDSFTLLLNFRRL